VAECSTAARSLGLSDTSPSDDGVTYDPPGCYFEAGSLKFNQGGNRGTCSSAGRTGLTPDTCLCKTGKATYELKTSGSCSTYIDSVAECSTAAKSLGLSDTSPSDDGATYDPPGCYLEAGSLKFNHGWNKGVCHKGDTCLCKTTTYELKTSGRCSTYIDSVAECSTAARSLGLSDTSPSDDGVTYDPPGCYFEAGSLKFNQGGNRGTCSSAGRTGLTPDTCLCKTGKATYELKTSGSCSTYIDSVAECSTAAKSLGLSDTSPSDDGATYDPPGCYLEAGSLKFNHGGNKGVCHKGDTCLCKR